MKKGDIFYKDNEKAYTFLVTLKKDLVFYHNLYSGIFLFSYQLITFHKIFHYFN